MPRALRFREDGHFTIVQFTDLHWRDGDDLDHQTRELMERVLDAETPDLVALTGDVISGTECRDPAESWRSAVLPMESRGVPWAAVLGNHDDEGALSRTELIAVQQTCPMCVSQPGPEHLTRVGNYVLTVRSAQGDSLAAALYFLDSGSYAPTDSGGYAWIAQDQIAWYQAESRRLSERHRSERRAGEKLPALAFFHIPLPEYNEVWDHYPCQGLKVEAVCCPRINSGFFAALEEAGDVLGAFVGHDHLNDYDGTLRGIRLCYGRATGYGGYGQDGFQRGARVIRLEEGACDFATWLRLADGSAMHPAVLARSDPPLRRARNSND